jgi:hypothetical protein
MGTDKRLQPIETMPRDGTVVLVTDGQRWGTANQPPNHALGWWRHDEPTGRWHGSTLGFQPTHWVAIDDVVSEEVA